jgi:type V secretory pathway adhesin AidA
MSCTTITKAKSINPCGTTLVLGNTTAPDGDYIVVFTNLATGRTQVEAGEALNGALSCGLPQDLASGNAYEVSATELDGTPIEFTPADATDPVAAVVLPVQKVFGSNGQVDEPVQDIRLVQ